MTMRVIASKEFKGLTDKQTQDQTAIETKDKMKKRFSKYFLIFF